MKRMIGICAALLLLIAAPTRADEGAFDPERLAVARQMVEASGAAALVGQTLDIVSRQIAELVRRANPEHGQAAADIVETVLVPEAKRRAPEMLEAMARVYAERFTAEELQVILDFYRTPTGQKMVAAGPELVVEAQRLGQAWAQLIMQDSWAQIVERLKANGMKPPPAI
jgi:uncharacterized protein